MAPSPGPTMGKILSGFRALLWAVRKDLRASQSRHTGALSCADVLLALPLALAQLMAHYGALRKAQVVVIMLHPSGFGPSIYDPDLTRRLFPDRRCVSIVLWRHAVHNPKLASIWPDIDVIFLRFRLNLRSELNPSRTMRFSLRLIQRCVRWIAGPQVSILSSEELHGLVPEPPIPETYRESATGEELDKRWLMGYFNRVQKEPVLPVRIPAPWRTRIRRRLSQVETQSQNIRGLCGLYLRQSGLYLRQNRISKKVGVRTRDGSTLEEYLPSIRALNQAGYQVLLTGDVELTPALSRELGGMLVDAKSLKVDPRWFSLYALSEVDIMVGENGGAIHLPFINKIPCLMLNVFAYYQGYPNTWMVYKTVRDQAGNLVHYDKLFRRHPYDWVIPGTTLHNNSSEEILQAVNCFLQDFSRLDEPDPNGHIVERLPENIWVKHAGARLSPAWLSLYQDPLPVTG